LATGNYCDRTKQLLSGKPLWFAIAATSCLVFVLVHTMLSRIPANALIATTGIAKTVDVTNTIASSIPLNFDVHHPQQSSKRSLQVLRLAELS